MGGRIGRLDSAVHLVILGLDSAGKSTVLYQLKFHQYIDTVPTIGFNCEKTRHCGVNFTIWDVGGQDRVRPLWRSYTRSTDGIIFVVDSRDLERIDEAKVELLKTARVPETLGGPIVILANKQDLPGSRDPMEIEKLLGLDEQLGGRPWAVRPACAVTGEGLNEALEEIHRMIIKRRLTLKQSKRKR